MYNTMTTTQHDLARQLAILGQHIQLLSDVNAIIVFHRELPATIRVNHKHCEDPKAVCRAISLNWRRISGETEDTYECGEYPIKLIHEKARMVRQVIAEELCFQQ